MRSAFTSLVFHELLFEQVGFKPNSSILHTFSTLTLLFEQVGFKLEAWELADRAKDLLFEQVGFKLIRMEQLRLIKLSFI